MQSVFESLESKLREFDVIVGMVADGVSNSVIVSGEPGIGKTFRCERLLQARDVKYEKVSGFITPKALYELLFEFRESVIIFDDADSAFKDPKALNLLKVALDDKKDRVLHYKSTANDALPSSFPFLGRVVILTNESLDQGNPHIRALASRAKVLRLDLSYRERLEYIRAHLLTQPYRETTQAEREAVFEAVRRRSIACPMRLTFRSYFEALDFHHVDKPQFESHLARMFPADSSEAIFLQIALSGRKGAEKVNAFMAETGKSRRTYFYYRERFFDLIRELKGGEA